MRSQRRRRRRIKRPNIINSLKRKAGQTGQVIDPTKYLPLPLPVPVFPLSPVRDMSRKFNPLMRNHLTNRANSNSSQGSMGDFREIVDKAFPEKTILERRDFEKKVTSKSDFSKTVDKAFPEKTIKQRREFEQLVTSKRTTPRRQVPTHEKRLTRMRRRMLDAEGKKSRKRRK